MNPPDADDREAHLVYADWLSERGDPRGELITVQIRREAALLDRALRKAEEQLLLDNGRAWLGELAKLDREQDFEATWRWGFIDKVRVGALTNREDGRVDVTVLLEQVMRLPHIERCRELVVAAFDDADMPSWQRAIDKLAEIGVPPALRRLEFWNGDFWDISATILGDLTPLYPRLRTLEELRIELGELELGKIDLPALRKLEIVTGGLTGGNLGSINAATWPALETLSLCLGQSGGYHGCDVQPDDLVPIYNAVRMPRVKHLALANSSIADIIVRDLVTSKILPRLETLDLSRGTLTDRGARVILDRPDAFAHLTRIDVSRSYLSGTLSNALDECYPQIIVRGQQRDQGQRFVQISE